MTGFSVDGPLSAISVQDMVHEIAPRWTVTDADACSYGTDAVYFVTVEAEDTVRELVLKACRSVDADAFRPEPYLLDAIARRTTIPVPSVVGAVDADDADDDFSEPFFLMERCDGQNVANRADDLSPQVRKRVATEAGRYLGELHDVGSFDRFGPVRLGEDGETDSRAGIVTPQYEVTVADDGRDAWRDWFFDLSDHFLDALDDRFTDLEPAIRRHLNDAADVLDGEFKPVLTHNDYRFWNLLIDPETGETNAVLDFGNEFTAHAEYNLAGAEERLSGWAPLDADRRQHVRECLYGAYSETNSLRRDGGFRDRRELYLLATRLPALAWFEDWHADDDEAKREAVAARHREFVRTITETR